MEAYNRLLIGNLLVVAGFLMLAGWGGRRRFLRIGAAIVLLAAGATVAIDALAKLMIG